MIFKLYSNYVIQNNTPPPLPHIKCIDSDKRLFLQRNEITALFNVFGRLSESVHANVAFQRMRIQTENIDWLSRVPVLGISLLLVLLTTVLYYR